MFSPVRVFACVCDFKMICEEYSLAKAVFTGKLVRVEESPQKPSANATAYFEVEKTFKGSPGKVEQMDFLIGGSCERKLTVGEIYFVYQSGEKYLNPCNRTDLLSALTDDLKYAEGLSAANPVFTIGGKINDLSKDELKNAEVWLETGQRKISLPLSEYGNFKFEAKEKSSYRVKMVLPFDAGIVMLSMSGKIGFSEGYHYEVTHSEKKTIIEYRLEFEPNSCNYRQVYFDKDYKIVSSKVVGKVLDESGNPVRGLFIYLYPKTPDQKFTNWDYSVGKTNETGGYFIDKLKPGSYILGINLGRTPSFEAPYPETFYPGQKTLDRSQVIDIGEGQNLTLQPFILPPKLKTVTLTGKTIWEDGTPATKFVSDSSPRLNPRIYLIDPITLKSDLGSLIVTDAQGNFSFTAFDGYSYIIHADGINAENQSLHAKRTIVKATQNTPPIVLMLNLKGNGRNDEEIKNEIQQSSGSK